MCPVCAIPEISWAVLVSGRDAFCTGMRAVRLVMALPRCGRVPLRAQMHDSCAPTQSCQDAVVAASVSVDGSCVYVM